MTLDQLLLFVIVSLTVVLFIWGRWRHDVVALAALLACVFAGLVPVDGAFFGVSHPAVITVACVLILSSGLQTTGAVDTLVQKIMPKSSGVFFSLMALIGLGAVLSAFMNNVGAMALLMPVAIQIARKHDLPAGKILMPLAFGTILGGMTTLIGTPPNLIVSGFRHDLIGSGFAMFDFSPVGGTVAAVGILFLMLFGRHLIPDREESGAATFDTGTYLTEVRVTEDGKAAGRTLHDIEEELEEVDAQIIGLIRNDLQITAPEMTRMLKPDDILIIEAEPESMTAALTVLGLSLEEDLPLEQENDEDSQPDVKGHKTDKKEKEQEETRESETSEMEIQEVVVMPSTALIGRTAHGIRLRSQYNLNLLAISRQGRRSVKRLRHTSIQAGDVLLLQGGNAALSGFISTFGCVPLAKRAINLPDKNQAIMAMIIMALAIIAAALDLVPAAISFATGVLAFMLLRIVPPRKAYEAVDWSIIILLGALIPVAGAMSATGSADLLAQTVLDHVAQGNPVLTLALLLVMTMILTDFMNNAATAAMMCPLAISLSTELQVNPDTYLMAVAVGASCAFLTPIGHQNNTLILGPGGFRFTDYWRVGLPMDVFIVATAIPLLLWAWPL